TSTVGASAWVASSNGMWRSIWACRQARQEHSGRDMPVWEQTVIRAPASRGITAPSVTGLTLSLEMLIVLLLCRPSRGPLPRTLQQGGIRTAYTLRRDARARQPEERAGRGSDRSARPRRRARRETHDLLVLRAHHLTQGSLPQLIEAAEGDELRSIRSILL